MSKLSEELEVSIRLFLGFDLITGTRPLLEVLRFSFRGSHGRRGGRPALVGFSELFRRVLCRPWGLLPCVAVEIAPYDDKTDEDRSRPPREPKLAWHSA